MAYVKFWTEAFGDGKFVAINATDRGVFLGLIIECKRQQDDGYVRFASYTGMAGVVHCDRRTASKCAAKLQQVCLINVTTDKYGNLEIYIPKYLKWQDVTAKDVVLERKKNNKKTRENQSLLTYHNITEHSTLAKPPALEDKSESKPKEFDLEKIEAFIEVYHQSCPSLPKVKDLTEPRKKTYSKVLKKQPDLDIWRRWFIESVHKSDLLSGRKGDWRASLDWILKPANYQKIKEGNYANKTKPTMSAREQYDREDAVHKRETGIVDDIVAKYQEVD